MPGTLMMEAPPAPSTARPDETHPVGDDAADSGLATGRIVTALLVAGPVVGLGLFIPFGWGHGISLGDIVIAATLYVFTGFGISAGFHRLFTHHSFKANRTLKVVLAVAGSMAMEGSVISWVAIHRRHHMFGDRPGDPHSPYRYGPGLVGTVGGFLWAQVGWLFANDPTDTKRFARDLLGDEDLVLIDRLFPVLAIASLALPFAIGWLAFGTLGAALSAFLWAGLVRVAVLHHVTWSINSVCHLWGRTPFVTKDRSTNVAPLAFLSFGESWHNFHHAAPSSARHGVLEHQYDLSAGLIRLLERIGWATKVRWPTSVQITSLRRMDASGRRAVPQCRSISTAAPAAGRVAS